MVADGCDDAAAGAVGIGAVGGIAEGAVLRRGVVGVCTELVLCV